MNKFFVGLSMALCLSTSAVDTPKSDISTATKQSVAADTFSLQLLNAAKGAKAKLQAKQDAGNDLHQITESKKNIEMMRLKAATEFVKQQVALEARKTDKSAMTALETKRKAMIIRYNELDRLIDQIGKHQKSDLLSEKLNDLIAFLEPAFVLGAQPPNTPVPAKKMSRGAAPAKRNVDGKK